MDTIHTTMIGTSYPLHTHDWSTPYILKGVWHTLYAMDGHKYVTSTLNLFVHKTTRTLAVSHNRGTNHMVMVMLGNDWGCLSISYTYQIHFIHIKVVWHTLYDVDGH